MAPRTAASCGEGLTPSGKTVLWIIAITCVGIEWDRGRLLERTVPCRVSYELLKSLIDEQDSLRMENAAFVLKDGVRIGENGCQVDATVLTKVLERIDQCG